MKKMINTSSQISLSSLQNKLRTEIIDKENLKLIIGGTDEAAKPQASHTRPLTGMYDEAMVGG